MKNAILVNVILLLGFGSAFTQSKTNKEYFTYFEELKNNLSENYELWDMNLYGSLLLVEPTTRQIIANEPDNDGLLKQEGNIYTGALPTNINIANTAMEWGGKRWAMVMLPLSENRAQRLDLLSHELFHRSQPALGFKLGMTTNNHLDQKDGRIYLRLELEALKQAVLSKSDSEVNLHLTNAFVFRKYRQQIYSKADSTENILELNEGMASYTGIILSGRNDAEIRNYVLTMYDNFLNYPTFVNSFAYQTIPMYGIILNKTNKFWNKQIKNETNLIDYFLVAFKISLPKDFEKVALDIKSKYNGDTIVTEETSREEINNQRLEKYKQLFIQNPHLTIKLEQMSISFDPRNIIPIEGHGTVYPKLRVTDNWGVLTIAEGALLGSSWNKVTVCEPSEIQTNRVSGNGWVLELNANYTVVKNNDDNNYSLVKNQ